MPRRSKNSWSRRQKPNALDRRSRTYRKSSFAGFLGRPHRLSRGPSNAAQVRLSPRWRLRLAVVEKGPAVDTVGPVPSDQSGKSVGAVSIRLVSAEIALLN